METTTYTKLQQELLQEIDCKKSVLRDFEDFEADGFTYSESIDYNRDTIIKKFPNTKESYIDSMIEKQFEDLDFLTWEFEQFSDSMNEFHLDILEEAGNRGLLYKGTQCFDGRRRYTEDNFETSTDGYDRATIKLKWSLPYTDDIYSEIEEAETLIEENDLNEAEKVIKVIDKSLSDFEETIDFIKKAEEELHGYYSKGIDITDEVIFRIEEADELEEYAKVKPPPTAEDILEFKSDFIYEIMKKYTGGNYTNALRYPEREFHSKKRILENYDNPNLKFTGNYSDRVKDIAHAKECMLIAFKRMLIQNSLNALTDKKLVTEIKKQLPKKLILKIINN